MNKRICAVAVLFLFLASSMAAAAPTVFRPGGKGNPELSVSLTPQIRVVQPQAGEVLVAESTFVIKWTFSGRVGATVKIELIDANGVVREVIAAGAPVGSGGTGVYSWKVPFNTGYVLGTTTGHIRVTGAEGKVSAGSGSFSVKAPREIRLTSPKGGESCQAGSAQTITWEYSNLIAERVEAYLLKGGRQVQALGGGSGRAGKGSMTWTLARDLVNGADYQIKLVSEGDTSVNDVSPVFAVTGGSVLQYPVNFTTGKLIYNGKY